MEKVGYAPTPVDFQSTASTKLASSPMVGAIGLEPMNPKERIYSPLQLPLCDTPNLVFSLPLNNHIASPMLLSDAYQSGFNWSDYYIVEVENYDIPTPAM